MKKIFIDGKEGTTGLRIYERLQSRTDITLLTLPEDLRKDPESRKKMLNQADIVFLCLPDAAAREAVEMIENPHTVVLDTSTAHRTDPDWLYGFPELSPAMADAVKTAKRIAVPGCHASGFIALVKPLIDEGLLAPDTRLTCHSITGYSGGGKKMIAQYEDPQRDPLLDAPRQYALGQTHKHLKEMQAITGLSNAPIFCPIVADFYSGMVVTVPLFAAELAPGKTVEDLQAVYAQRYTGPVVYAGAQADPDGLLSGVGCKMRDRMDIAVFGNTERILLTARYDNLGKGASGAAIQLLNMVLGTGITTGLEI